ncbi:MAG: iron-sulfur cluster carrier protein MrpORP [Syntrophales bacterium]|nr:iron-sulfur cluster carrier protein MrpORP [Syntrophales bacterium]
MDCQSKDTGRQEHQQNHGAQDRKKQQDHQKLTDRMGRIEHKLMVLSGKGGVGKSTVSANIAVALALENKKVGLLDLDFHGPSIPKLLRLEQQQLRSDGNALLPVEYLYGIKVMSIGFITQERDTAVMWRGPMKMGAIQQFLSEVEWGELDYLIIDLPPGTGDEPLSAAQLLPDSDGAVIVTTPQDMALSDVRKSINFCRELKLSVIGVIENMSGLACPHCQTVIDVFKRGGGEAMANEMGVPFLGRIPLDPMIVETSDDGTPFIHLQNETETAKAFMKALDPIMNLDRKKPVQAVFPMAGPLSTASAAKIAIPISGGLLCAHFGHCDTFALMDIDMAGKKIIRRADVTPPPHEPGLLPKWLHEKGADIIIAGGMGSRAQGLFAENSIQVVCGAPADTPEMLVMAYMNGSLDTGQNVCDH